MRLALPDRKAGQGGIDVRPKTDYMTAMSAVPFDTLKLARKLEAAGFAPKQAADTAEALADAFKDTIATRQDITDVRTDIRASEQTLTIRMGAMVIALGGFLTAIKYFG